MIFRSISAKIPARAAAPPGYKAGLLQYTQRGEKYHTGGDHDAQALQFFSAAAAVLLAGCGAGATRRRAHQPKAQLPGTVCRRHRSGGVGRLCLLWSGYGRLQPEKRTGGGRAGRIPEPRRHQRQTVTDWQGGLDAQQQELLVLNWDGILYNAPVRSARTRLTGAACLEAAGVTTDFGTIDLSAVPQRLDALDEVLRPSA